MSAFESRSPLELWIPRYRRPIKISQRFLDKSKSSNVQSSFTQSQCVTRRCVDIIFGAKSKTRRSRRQCEQKNRCQDFGLGPSSPTWLIFQVTTFFVQSNIRYFFVVWVLDDRHLCIAVAYLELLKASCCSCFLSVVVGSFSFEVGDRKSSTTCRCCRLDGDQIIFHHQAVF